MKSILRTTIIQAPLVWENAEANKAYFTEQISALEDTTHLIVLPEMFTTGFSMNATSLAENMDGETTNWLKQQAEQSNAAICGSLIIQENGNYYNRFVFARPNGTIETYDKRHLFTLANEQRAYTAGTERKIIHYRDWKICPMICYDLRFPVWSRNVEGYDLLIYVANFPAKRAHAWKSLLLARAIENQCYVVGVNRIGTDGNDIPYNGDSVVLDYNGQILFHAKNETITQTVRLDYLRKANFRDRFQFLEDRDQFEIRG